MKRLLYVTAMALALHFLLLSAAFSQSTLITLLGAGGPASSSPIAVIDHNSAGGVTQFQKQTTPALNCTGADAMLVGVTGDGGVPNATVTDSVGTLSYTLTTAYSSGGNAPDLAWFWATGSSGAFSGSMTVSAQCTSGACSPNGYDTGILAVCLSNVNASPVTQVNGNHSYYSGATSVASGNVSTSASNIVFTLLGINGSGSTCTLPSGYTSIASSTASGQPIQAAYKTSPSNPEDPNWTSCPNVALTSTTISLHQ